MLLLMPMCVVERFGRKNAMQTGYVVRLNNLPPTLPVAARFQRLTVSPAGVQRLA